MAEQAAGSNGTSRDMGGREGPGKEASAAVGAETEVVTLPVLPLVRNLAITGSRAFEQALQAREPLLR